MVRKATISTFNFHYCTVNPTGSVEEYVNYVMLFLENKINHVLPDRPDLIVLPECCDMPAGCTGEKLRDYYRVRGDRILHGLSDLAVRHRCYIAYPSIRLLDDGTWRNSVRLIDRNGGVAGTYDKNHPVIVEMEKDGIVCGNEAPIFSCDFGTVGCAICFDLNFEPLRAKYAAERPDLILFPSMFHGGFVQQHWAYSCRAHFVGAIAGGLPSSIISPVGQLVSTTSSYFDYRSETVNLDCAVVHLDNNRERLEAMRRKYGTKVKVTDPGYLGSVLISSETDECTVHDLIREFKFELLDEYLMRSLAHHRNDGISS
ncbi:carbon-nitrogen hydrolase family protein [Paenibacillus sp. MBLB4367]|uniref:carbon-nitrogen hydrolase family protein n=1 Tax=Paenibacillus sp. MBLB4367 TaxID=3384767 RepID=UPI00390837EE